jgi:hypothetical protein
MPLFDQNWTGQILWMVLFFSFILLYPKYMLYRMIAEMEKVAETLEGYTREAVDIIIKTSKEKGGVKEDPKRVVENALEFFLIGPVDLDPYGILKKVEHLLDKSESRFEEIAARIAPEGDDIWRANTVSLLKGGIGLNIIAKTVRHYVEFVKKTGNFQIAMIIQMSLPMIKKIAKAQMKGVECIAEGKPIGDGIGPLVAANLVRGDGGYEVAKDVICHDAKISGRDVLVLKAKGPGATLGKIGDGVKKVCKDNDVAKIITIDASLKLEGEKTGKVAEGIGAAIGDPGPEKAKIEEAALEKNLPLEAYAIKMSIEEAISPLTKDINESVPKAIELIEESLERTDAKGRVVIVGVGNTCGIGNTYEAVRGLEFPEKEEEKKEETLADKIIKTLVVKPPPKKPKKKVKQD